MKKETTEPEASREKRSESAKCALFSAMLSKFFSMMVKTASLALGEISSRTEKIPPEKVERITLTVLQAESDYHGPCVSHDPR